MCTLGLKVRKLDRDFVAIVAGKRDLKRNEFSPWFPLQHGESLPVGSLPTIRAVSRDDGGGNPEARSPILDWQLPVSMGGRDAPQNPQRWRWQASGVPVDGTLVPDCAGSGRSQWRLITSSSFSMRTKTCASRRSRSFRSCTNCRNLSASVIGRLSIPEIARPQIEIPLLRSFLPSGTYAF